MQKLRETMTDTLLSTYYYLDLEIIKILVLISWHPALCIYLYPSPTHNPPSPLPPTPRWTSGHSGPWTWNNQKEVKLRREDSSDELIIIKRKENCI